MSSQINRLLLSTCLPVMALSISLAPTTVRAGFDWTPPEDTQEVIMPDVPAPVVKGDALPPVDDRSAQDSNTPVFEQPLMDTTRSESEGSKMKVKVLRPHEKQTQAEEPAAEMPPETIPMPPPETMPEPPQDNGHFTPMPDEHPPEAVPHEEPVKFENPAPAPQEMPPIEPVPEQAPLEVKENGELSINPFPLQDDGQVAQEMAETPVVLPADPEQTLKKITPTPAHAAVEKSDVAGEAIQWNENEAFPVTEGFGKDMPLVMALGQIVPAKYAYSFGKGVNPGTLVSWDGGKPWNEVLHSVLAPLHIGMKIENKTLSMFTLNPPQVEENTAQPEVLLPVETQPEAPIVEEITTMPAESTPTTEQEDAAATPMPEDTAATPMPEDVSASPQPLSEDPADEVPEEEDAEPIIETEADKTTALQAEQIKKINPAPAEMAAPEPVKETAPRKETERYNFEMPAQAEQKKK